MGINHFSSQSFSPEDLAIFREEHQRLMHRLANQTLMQVAIMRLEGHKSRDIADAFAKSDRWVRRKLTLIRAIWNCELESNDP